MFKNGVFINKLKYAFRARQYAFCYTACWITMTARRVETRRPDRLLFTCQNVSFQISGAIRV